MSRFACLGAACPDTCCAGWEIEVDAPTKALYDGESMLQDVTDTLANGDVAMRCTGKDERCVMNRDGWCRIQQEYGQEWLSDSCYFFPRTYRRLGGQRLAGLSLACPEAARLTLFEPWQAGRHLYTMAREMVTAHDRLPVRCAEEVALAVHAAILSAVEDGHYCAEQQLARIVMLCDMLETTPHRKWRQVVMQWRGMPPPPPSEEGHPENMRQLVRGMWRIARRLHSQERVYAVLRDMEVATGIVTRWQEEGVRSPVFCQERLEQEWWSHQAIFREPMRHWLAAMVANWAFPFGGLAKTPRDQAFLLVLHFAITRLALQARLVCHGAPDAAQIVAIVQPIARLLDHITDAAVFFDVFDQTEWMQERRLRSLFGG